MKASNLTFYWNMIRIVNTDSPLLGQSSKTDFDLSVDGATRHFASHLKKQVEMLNCVSTLNLRICFGRKHAIFKQKLCFYQMIMIS